MSNLSPKKLLLPAFAGVACALVLLGLIHRDDLTAMIVTNVSEANKVHISQYVGQPAPMDFKVASAANPDRQVSILELLDEQGMVITYQESCPACRSAVNHYLALRRGRPDYGETVYLLADETEQRIPTGFPARQFIQFKKPTTDTMFEGRASPRIFRFDNNGVLSEFMVGYQSLRLEEWIISMYGE